MADNRLPPVACPRCGQSTDSLKDYNVLNFLFIFVYVVWSTERVVACPQCMRAFLTKRLLLAIPFSNFLFPFTAPIYLGQIFGTHRKGHSQSALAQAFRLDPEERAAVQQVAERRGRPMPRKDKIVLSIIAFFILALWGGGYLYMKLAANQQNQVVTTWIELLNDPDEANRMNATHALGNMGPKAVLAIPQLQRIARTDVSVSVQFTAYQALLAIDRDAVRGLPVPEAPFMRPRKLKLNP